MGDPVINRMWLSDRRNYKARSDPFSRANIRLDWSNDRHHSIDIEPPYGPKEVVKALDKMADLVAKDKHMREES